MLLYCVVFVRKNDMMLVMIRSRGDWKLSGILWKMVHHVLDVPAQLESSTSRTHHRAYCRQNHV